MAAFFPDCSDYHLSPEEKAEEVANFKLNLGRFTPSHLLKWAEDYEFIPEALKLEQAAYLVPYYNLLTEIKRLIRIDDKEQFASFLKANHELVQNYSPDGLLQLLCSHSAVACVTALLESRLDVDINSMDRKLAYHTGMSPLHIAACNLSFSMTKLLLEHGADAEIHSDAYGTPLHIVLAAFKKHKYIGGWTADKSILMLLYFFCLPALKEPLDTVRLLASHSNKVEDLCICYMNFDRVTDYAALLMVAWDKLMDSSAEGGLETTPVGQHLSRVLSNASLQQEICESNFNVLSKERLVKHLTTAFSVVKTMWMTIGVLERYCHSRVESVPMHELPFHIACELVTDAGLYLKSGGANIECFQPNLTSEAKVLLKRKYYAEPRRSGPILRSFLGKPVTAASLSLMPHFQYRTLHILNFMDNHLCKTPQVKPSSHNVLALAKVCAPLVWMAKRSIK
ncbi:hypothetical protein BVRB_001430 [Beta vulgaris subsp. vulgaris]|uniref:Uncharacterized protein n=1 Tax=Beta vulgaris subsp. vulgaris TaxID=3555 RepID=A0A0J8B4Q0_BETVV|nr:hypothetical protein BVRB_001430 [Beta vulgaris subsp. vulgaris]